MSNELLTKNTVTNLAESVEKLAYDPAKATSGIVHIGIGAFHRAHQAVYTNDLLALGENQWKITAVSLRSANIRNQMQPQDYVYSVLERSNNEDKISLVGAIEQVLVAPENPQRVIDVLADTSTKVVTLTVTEKGYCRDKSGVHLDLTNPAVVNDLNNLSAPQSVPGFIVAACQKRRTTNSKLTIVSCDNLPSNGRVTQAIVLEFAEQVNPDIAAWIKENVSFCNSMVDRIVPATTEDDITLASSLLGVQDNSVVITEPFKQWVIEDNFVNDKPAWDKVGALFVKEVCVYEDMKLRLLNGSHSTLAYIGFLMGYDYIHQAVTDPDCNQFVQLLQKQMLTTLDDVAGVNLPVYAQSILDRFANQRVPYKTTQVACDGSQKLAQRLLKPADIMLTSGQISDPVALVIASWCRFLEGRDHQGENFTVIDPLAETLTKLAVTHKTDEQQQVLAILKESGICSAALLANDSFIEAITGYLTAIHQNGMQATLKLFLSSLK